MLDRAPGWFAIKAEFGDEQETKTKAGALAIRSTRPSGTGLGASTAEPAKTSTMLLGLYFLGWYVLNVGYNIYVKKTLNVLPLPFTFAVLQLGIGFIWLAPQWLSGIRKVPKPSKQNWKALSKVAAFHGLGQLATVMAMGLGSVSFVNVVKALEPVCTALIALLVTGVGLPWQVWLSMLPVCAGVGMASLSELSFTWACFGAAMTSNVVYATRGVLSKISMTMDDAGENMDAANTYAVVTGIAFLFTLPIALVLEGAKVGAGLAAVTAAGWTMGKLAYMVLCTGLLYYTYNEMAFLVLGSVAPITQSVGNTVKRVVVIVAAALVFRTPMTPMGIAGSTVAILGVLLYSLVRSKFPDVPAKVGQPFRSPKTPFPY
jgi:solute carrier family 35 protein E1